MNTSVLSSQGQTTIPAPVRKYLGLEPNQELTWKVSENAGVKYVTVSAASKAIIHSLRGVAKQEYKKHGGGKKYLEKERTQQKENSLLSVLHYSSQNF